MGFKKGSIPWNKGKTGLQVGWLKGGHHSKETKKKIREALKGNKCHLGHHHSEESKLKMSLARKLRITKDETKEKIRLAHLGKKSWRWKGGKIKSAPAGYIMIYKPDHPFVAKLGYVLEHRLVMEKFLNRYLLPEEVVHHINGVVDDNRIENLMLFANNVEHKAWHYKIKKLALSQK
jgi:hypothetical protein